MGVCLERGGGLPPAGSLSEVGEGGLPPVGYWVYLHWGRGSASREVGQTPPALDTTGYCRQVGGTHPAGIHSCLPKLYSKEQHWPHFNLITNALLILC